jgi:hypothetical protein
MRDRPDVLRPLCGRISVPILATLIAGALAAAPVPAVAAGLAPHPKPGGTYRGSSSQRLPVSFHIRGSKRVAAHVVESFDCGDVGFEMDFTIDARLKKHRSFKVSFTESEGLGQDASLGEGDLTGDFTTQLSGRFYRAKRRMFRRLKGTFRDHVDVKDAAGAVVKRCDTGPVTYTAKLVRG